MRKVFVWQWGRFGSGPRIAFELSDALRTSCGCEVLLSLAEDAEIFESDYVRTSVDLPIKTYRSVTQFAQRTLFISRIVDPVIRRLQEWRPDFCVLAMTGYWDIFLVRRLRQLGIPVITIIHDASSHPGDSVPVLRWLEQYLIGYSDAIITHTDFVHRRLRLRKHLVIKRQQTIAHPSFVFPDLRLDTPTAPRYPQRKPLRILLAGRLRKYKGVDLFIRAVGAIDPELLSVRIAGSLNDPDLQSKAEALKQIELRQGWLSEAEFVTNVDWADIVVLPYTEASQSGIIPTAYARHRPVIATPVGGLPEQVEQGVTGSVTRDVSSDAIREAILEFINQPSLIEGYSTGAGKTAAEKLDWGTFGTNILQFFQRWHR
ncbi:MAG: glycosyltransferase family 4 protein [Alphaproteobacteria bacterium]|nr:glycosyltransferase family 4 protein [Alphaproteobacteria bacterium]